MRVTLVQATPDPINLIATVASISYGNDSAKNPRVLVKKLYESGHHSVFEHVYFTFKIEGISRACSHQLVRHRICSFTQRSQRYCDESDFEFVIPPSYHRELRESVFEGAMYGIQKGYTSDTEHGIPKEDARYALPNAACTDLYMSFNLREFIHICNERLCVKAQWEIRELVENMVKLVDDGLKFMLVPFCQSGLYICNGCNE